MNYINKSFPTEPNNSRHSANHMLISLEILRLYRVSLALPLSVRLYVLYGSYILYVLSIIFCFDIIRLDPTILEELQASLIMCGSLPVSFPECIFRCVYI